MPDITQYAPLWGSWHIESLIGEGSFGKVYKVHKEEFGKTYYSAVKIISIPQSDVDLRHMRNEGLDEVSVKSYFQAFVSDILQEIDLMSQLRGNSNIVSFEDHKVIERTDGFGWDILIRMELLQSLSERCTEQPMDEAEVVKLGIHICRALELCARTKTIHRDIKPDNIFVSAYGDYKLGDFGIARQIERTMTGLSKKGTYTYMAPEVFKGDEYGASVDFYSLGIVMYRLLNKNRTPFLPSFPAPIMPADRDSALQRRMKGEALPSIPGVSDALNAIILKACAFDRKERFASATEMREALETYAAKKPAVVTAPVIVPATVSEPESVDEKNEVTVGAFDALPQEKTEVTVGVFDGVPQSIQPEIAADQPGQRKKRTIWVVLAVVAVCVVAVLFAHPIANVFNRISGDNQVEKATPHYEAGYRYYLAGDYEAALSEFQEAIRLNPGYPIAIAKRGLVYCALGEYEKAVEDYLNNPNPNWTEAYDADAKSTYAHAFLSVGKERLEDSLDFDVFEYFDTAVELDSANADAYYYRGIARNRDSNYGGIAEIIADFNKAVELNPELEKLESEVYARAFFDNRLTFEMKDYTAEEQEAQYRFELAHCTKAIALNPAFAYAYEERAYIYRYNLRDIEKAIQDYTKFLELEPETAHRYCDRGELYEEQGKYDLAIKDYTNAIKYNPDNCVYYNRRADVYRWKLNQYDMAIKDYTSIVTMVPDFDAEVYSTRGWCYLLIGEHKKALADADSAIALNGNCDSAYNLRGAAYHGLRQYENAIQAYNKAVQLVAAPAYYENRAIAYDAIGETQKAAADRAKAKELR